MLRPAPAVRAACCTHPPLCCTHLCLESGRTAGRSAARGRRPASTPCRSAPHKCGTVGSSLGGREEGKPGGSCRDGCATAAVASGELPSRRRAWGEQAAGLRKAGTAGGQDGRRDPRLGPAWPAPAAGRCCSRRVLSAQQRQAGRAGWGGQGWPSRRVWFHLLLAQAPQPSLPPPAGAHPPFSLTSSAPQPRTCSGSGEEGRGICGVGAPPQRGSERARRGCQTLPCSTLAWEPAQPCALGGGSAPAATRPHHNPGPNLAQHTGAGLPAGLLFGHDGGKGLCPRRRWLL